MSSNNQSKVVRRGSYTSGSARSESLAHSVAVISEVLGIPELEVTEWWRGASWKEEGLGLLTILNRFWFDNNPARKIVVELEYKWTYCDAGRVFGVFKSKAVPIVRVCTTSMRLVKNRYKFQLGYYRDVKSIELFEAVWNGEPPYPR